MQIPERINNSQQDYGFDLQVSTLLMTKHIPMDKDTNMGNRIG